MKRILLIENDDNTRELVRLILKESEFEVIELRRKIPVEKIIELQPHLILLDYLLDDGRGSDVCLELKSNPAAMHIPIILFSARNDVDRIAFACKADSFIAKPFDMHYLKQKVKEMSL